MKKTYTCPGCGETFDSLDEIAIHSVLCDAADMMMDDEEEEEDEEEDEEMDLEPSSVLNSCVSRSTNTIRSRWTRRSDIRKTQRCSDVYHGSDEQVFRISRGITNGFVLDFRIARVFVRKHGTSKRCRVGI